MRLSRAAPASASLSSKPAVLAPRRLPLRASGGSPRHEMTSVPRRWYSHVIGSETGIATVGAERLRPGSMHTRSSSEKLIRSWVAFLRRRAPSSGVSSTPHSNKNRTKSASLTPPTSNWQNAR
eukprot:Amastigsp_a11441_4.p3 type:complete len:123 gc:universal Amastigsp_a11441_4:798-430(-)